MKNFKSWYYYFLGNADHLDLLNFHSKANLTNQEIGVTHSGLSL